MQTTKTLLLVGLLGLLGSKEALAQWPDKMPALGPDSAQGVYDLLVKPGSDSDAFALGFNVDGVEVSLDKLAVVLSQAAGKQCRLALGASAGDVPVRQRLGGILVTFQCGPDVPVELADLLYDKLMAPLTAQSGLPVVLNLTALPQVEAVPEQTAKPQETEVATPWQDHGVSLLAGLLLLGVVAWLSARIFGIGGSRGKAAWAEIGLGVFSATAAVLVPRVGHPLYEGLFWSIDQEPWDTTRSQLMPILGGHPAQVPQSWNQFGVVFSMGLVVLLGVFVAEMVRRFRQDGTVHRWIPGIVVLALPLNYVLGGGIWVVVMTLALGAMVMNLGAEPFSGDSEAVGLSSGKSGAGTEPLTRLLGGLGVAAALAIPAGFWVGLGAFGLWCVWQIGVLTTRCHFGPRAWPMAAALLASGTLMVVGRLEWVPSSAEFAAPLDDLPSEGTSLLAVGALILAGAGRLISGRSWQAAVVLLWAVSGLAIWVGLPPGAFSRLLLAAVPASVVLGIAGVDLMGGVLAGRDRILLLGIVTAVLLHHHLFQLFMRLAPYTG